MVKLGNTEPWAPTVPRMPPGLEPAKPLSSAQLLPGMDAEHTHPVGCALLGSLLQLSPFTIPHLPPMESSATQEDKQAQLTERKQTLPLHWK